MAIYPPGQKFRNSRVLRKKGKRELVAILSLTAMVDMFTVLVIFLLQNYNPETNAVLYIPKEVTLPKAEKIRELKPAVVVTVSTSEITMDRKVVVTTPMVKQQKDWLIVPLQNQLVAALRLAKDEFERNFQVKLQQAAKAGKPEEGNPPWSKVTIQADKNVDFLTVKKVMYTVTEAGASEMNFAVIKEVH